MLPSLNASDLTFYVSLHTFFRNLALKRGTRDQYHDNVYISQDGRTLIDPSNSMREDKITHESKEYYRYPQLQTQIEKMHRIHPDIADWSHATPKNLEALLNFFNSISTCSVSEELMKAPIYLVNISGTTPQTYEFRSLIGIKMVFPRAKQTAHFTFKNLILNRVLFSAIQQLSRDTQAITQVSTPLNKPLDQIKAIHTTESLEQLMLELYPQLFSLLVKTRAELEQNEVAAIQRLTELQIDMRRSLEEPLTFCFNTLQSFIPSYIANRWGYSPFKSIAVLFMPIFGTNDIANTAILKTAWSLCTSRFVGIHCAPNKATIIYSLVLAYNLYHTLYTEDELTYGTSSFCLKVSGLLATSAISCTQRFMEWNDAVTTTMTYAPLILGAAHGALHLFDNNRQAQQQPNNNNPAPRAAPVNGNPQAPI